MKASELIAKLQCTVTVYGDLPVNYSNGGDDASVDYVNVYDKVGEIPEVSNKKPYEIYLHCDGVGLQNRR